MTDFYHVCFAVPDIEPAMRDLTTAAGVEWNPVKQDKLGEWEFQIVFSRKARPSSHAAPYIELIQGPPGSPWDVTETGARCDHIGFWAQDLEAQSRRWEAEGFPTDFSGCPYGRPFAYHRADSLGIRLELVDASRQAGFLAAWDPEGGAMPVLDT
ncbi:hypothetical protein CDO52_13380 [Nocardiopsis gilva YIM 90087]|uniref:VOC domain-containing protein n=1 Tax=Nocardiopsis gilva YIM 90087 TaxID=1235441 RepID=A0A223S6I4_9ACTN|nr:VOC family protein [Nocardiopsis gilva]ASU83649.1 hypothetical protein CDO52_13380 [Nocardiopsis gilva YIM 90087]